jgi:hypothetical protein
MVKFVPLALLAGMATAAVVAAPKTPAKEGLVSHEAAGKAYVVRKLPDRNGEWWITANLKVRYVVAGLPGETYTVELWLGLPDELVARDRVRAHFDTQEVTIPGEGTKLTEVKGLFDRRGYDRPPEGTKDRPPPPWFELKPGTYTLVGPGGLGKAWECRLVVKKKGKTLSDTGFFRVVLPPVVDF